MEVMFKIISFNKQAEKVIRKRCTYRVICVKNYVKSFFFYNLYGELMYQSCANFSLITFTWKLGSKFFINKQAEEVIRKRSMYRGSCVKSYPKNELEVIDKSYANHKRRSGTDNHCLLKLIMPRLSGTKCRIILIVST